MASPPNCSYCGEIATLVAGDVLFAHKPALAQKQFWECAACQAWVGCHALRGGDDPQCPRPLGTLADASLRRWRTSAHALFDTLWQSGQMPRNQAYEWLARQMRMPVAQCHIGGFDEKQCKAVTEICARLPD